MKASRPDYAEDAFFFEEPFQGGRRIVAWDAREEKQKALFFTLLATFGDRIEYLFKERDFRPPKSPETQEPTERWIRLFGGVQKCDLLHLISMRDSWFFADSGFQLCVREPDKPAYFAYDEHGVFFLYDLPHSAELLTHMGFANRERELVSDQGHWELRPADGEKQLARFKRALKRKSLFCDDEAERL